MTQRGLRKATVVGWSGRGRLENLRTSLKRILEEAGKRGTVTTSGGSIIVRGPEPASIASILRKTPGVSWVAVGMASETLRDMGESARVLGKRYLKVGSRFSVSAVGGEGISPSDITGAVVSSALEAVRGVRVDEEKPQLVFRASLSDAGGGVGVEISKGPGGVPTGNRTATVLLSGGTHSSVLCWMALLSGYRLRMVHAKVNDESLLAVARLYAELSHRVNPADLTLDVLFSKDPGSSVNWAARTIKPPVYAGFHFGCSDWTGRHRAGVFSPLYLAQEEWFLSESSMLLLKPYTSRISWGRRPEAPAEVYTFGGVRGDVNRVLDALVSRPRKSR